MTTEASPEPAPLLRAVPENGILVLEANAGSGKTQTLTSLCLQLVAEGRARPAQLLAITFTRAAAEELRRRIEREFRARLRELRNSRAEGKPSVWMQAMLQHLQQLGLPADPQEVEHRLYSALLYMDEAVICTIDSLCQRLLREQALELGLPARLGDPGSDHRNLELACLHWWREQMQRDPQRLNYLSNFKVLGPSKLARQIQQWRRHCGGRLRLLEESDDRLLKIDAEVRQQEQRRLALGGNPNFSDLSLLLMERLETPAAASLRRKLQQRFRAVLNDETQDNNQMQSDILLQLFGPGEDGNCLLVFIGDPKQAIFYFRGGELQTWFDLVGRPDCQSLRPGNDNWRSNEALVRAVNRLFGNNPFSSDPASRAGIDYSPSRVPPQARPQSLEVDGRNEDGIRVVTDFGGLDPSGRGLRPNHEKDAAFACAAEIALLLQKSRQNRATLSRDGQAVPVQAGDVAVLTWTNAQSLLIKEALEQRGIYSLLHDNRKVIRTPETFWLLYLLRALAEPTNLPLLRIALATPLLAEQPDDATLEAWTGRFQHWHRLGVRQGFCPALLQLLLETGTPHRLLEQAGGQRSLTNLLHLIELLARSGDDRRPLALRRQLEGMMATQEDEGPEEYEMRLETDEDLVQVSTIHRAKGLEYPLVFLPFLWKPSQVRVHSGEALLCRDSGDRPSLRLSKGKAGEADYDRSRAEREDEQIRLIYVALTRARSHVRIYWRPPGSRHWAPQRFLRSATGTEEEETDRSVEASLQARPQPWQQIAADSGGSIRVEQYQSADESPPGRRAGRRRGSARAFNAPPVVQQIAITNYTEISSLLSGGEHGGDWSEQKDRDQFADPEAEDEAGPQRQSLADFPRGRETGIFFHGVLESLVQDGRVGAEAEQMTALCEERLERAGIAPHWAPIAGRALHDLTRARLPGADCCLAELEADGRSRLLSELEFELPLGAGWQRVLGPIAGDRESLKPGFLKGFIDLVMSKDGRYYLADLKTNRLADDRYGEASLAAAARAHHYDLQMKLYSLALHRHLQRRLPEYDYERHFGGSLLMFLRGIRAGSSEGILETRLPAQQMQRLDREVR